MGPFVTSPIEHPHSLHVKGQTPKVTRLSPLLLQVLISGPYAADPKESGKCGAVLLAYTQMVPLASPQLWHLQNGFRKTHTCYLQGRHPEMINIRNECVGKRKWAMKHKFPFPFWYTVSPEHFLCKQTCSEAVSRIPYSYPQTSGSNHGLGEEDIGQCTPLSPVPSSLTKSSFRKRHLRPRRDDSSGVFRSP